MHLTSVGKAVLLGILPNEQRSTHMNIERANKPHLRDLHTVVQGMDEVCWDAFPFVAVEGKGVWGRGGGGGGGDREDKVMGFALITWT